MCNWGLSYVTKSFSNKILNAHFLYGLNSIFFQLIGRHLLLAFATVHDKKSLGRAIILASSQVKYDLMNANNKGAHQTSLSRCGIWSAPMLFAIWKVIMSRDMRFSTMWYVPPAKAQTSLHIRAFVSRFNILWLLSHWLNTIWSF